MVVAQLIEGVGVHTVQVAPIQPGELGAVGLGGADRRQVRVTHSLLEVGVLLARPPGHAVAPAASRTATSSPTLSANRPVAVSSRSAPSPAIPETVPSRRSGPTSTLTSRPSSTDASRNRSTGEIPSSRA